MLEPIESNIGKKVRVDHKALDDRTDFPVYDVKREDDWCVGSVIDVRDWDANYEIKVRFVPKEERYDGYPIEWWCDKNAVFPMILDKSSISAMLVKQYTI